MPVKTVLAVITFCLLLVLPQFVPAVANLKSFDWRTISAVWDMPIPKLPGATDTVVLEHARARRLDVLAPRNLLDPNHELDHFYESLRKGETIRVLHYGDSPTTADLVTGDVRALLQKQFGDAGTGFT